jgi:ribonuclease BN (tRNA processing enzyme)
MTEIIKVHFLGTNGWYTTDTGYTSCHLIDAPSCYIILDAGDALFRIEELIVEDKPIYLFLSHFHLDHISGLHILNKFRFRQGLNICLYESGQSILENIIKQPYTVSFLNLPYQVSINQIRIGRNDGLPFGLKAAELVHSTRCLGFRFEFSSKSITYCTDTGFCPELVALARNTELLITECALKPGQTSPNWPHLNPADAAQAAIEAEARQLVLVHFDAENYGTLDDRILAQADAAKTYQNVKSAFDNDIISV